MLKRLGAVVAATSVILASSMAAHAAPVSLASNTVTAKARSIIVDLRDSAISSEFSRVSAAKSVSSVRDLGANWFALKFKTSVTQSQVDAFLARLRSDANVKSAAYDLPLKPAEVSKPKVAAPRISGLRLSTPVLNLAVQNGFDPSTPLVPRLIASWDAPANTYGGVVAGYEVDLRPGLGSWQVIAQSNQTRSIIISSGLSAGTAYQIRVRAITKLGASTAVRPFSKSVSAIPTTAPAAPVVTTPTTITQDATVRWQIQSKAARGGLAVTYQAVASASGETSLSCTTTKTYCAIRGTKSGVAYQVTVSATNSLGSATSSTNFIPQDALYSQQWYLNSQYGIKADKAWKITMGNPSVVVAVLDSGITKHPDLDSQLVPGYDFVSDPASSNDGDGWDPDASDPGDYSQFDSSWHGTHVAGIIAAAANSIGVIGVAPLVKIQPVRVLGSQGGQTSDLIAALHWAAGIHVKGVPDNKTPAKVINMSMGTDSYSICDTGTANAVQDVINMGVTMLTAAGNYSTDAFGSYPGNCYGTINVGATGFTGDLSSYSDFGLGVDISAPGGDSQNPGNAPVGSNGAILSTINTGKTTPGSPDYAYEEGTSMATPVVAGVVALMYSVNPKITPAQVWQGLKATASPFLPGSLCALTVGHTDRNLYSRSQLQRCGAGIVNAEGAVQFALTTK